MRWASAYPRFVPHNGPVLCESEDAVTVQMQHFYEYGHRKIAYIDEFDTMLPSWHFLVRRERYYRFMAEHGLKAEAHYVFPVTEDSVLFAKRLDRMFAENPPTAVIVPSSMLSMFYHYCELHHLAIGRDISLTGFERYVEIPLQPEPTAIRQDIMDAARTLFGLLQLPTPEERISAIRYTDCHLHLGGSVMNLNEIS